MLTPTEITTGTGRLTANKLKASDQETLLGVFKLYLKNRAADFPLISERLAAVTDSGEIKTASKLAAILIALEENGFDLSELKGGRSGLQTDGRGEMVLKIRFALSLLGYDLPEEFSGSLASGNENIGGGGVFFPSVVVNAKPSW